MLNTLYLFFYCPVTGKLVKCGKNGEGYALSSLKGWVKQLLPVVRAGLFLAKIVLSTQGLGGVIPSFPNGEDQDQLSSMLDDLTVGVEKTASALEGMTTTDSLEDCIIGSLKDELMDGIVVAVAKEDGVQNVADIRAYRPKNSGLVQAQYTHTNGAVTYAWVSTEGRAAFELQGPAAFRQVT